MPKWRIWQFLTNGSYSESPFLRESRGINSPNHPHDISSSEDAVLSGSLRRAFYFLPLHFLVYLAVQQKCEQLRKNFWIGGQRRLYISLWFAETNSWLFWRRGFESLQKHLLYIRRLTKISCSKISREGSEVSQYPEKPRCADFGWVILKSTDSKPLNYYT